jgi:arylsulfatase
VDPQFGKIGKQKIENTGPLNTKRMETIDEEFLDGALKFIDKAHADNKPFFCWFNSTRMHVFTHLKKESQGVTGLGLYPDGMVEHDGMVGQLLQKLDDLGIADNTIVMWSTDNGADTFTWPDGGTTPFRSEKDTKLGGRLARAVRYPLAGCRQAGHGVRRNRCARGHAAHDSGGGRRRKHRRRA